MDILDADQEDIAEIYELVKDVAETSVLPHFNIEGQTGFRRSIYPDISLVLGDRMAVSYKLVHSNRIIGFAALQSEGKLTHLFIHNDYHRKGLGYKLLCHVVEHANNTVIRLRASINAVGFYESVGFKAINDEQEVRGIRYIRMQLIREKVEQL